MLVSADILRVTIRKPWWVRPRLGQYVFLNFPEMVSL